MITPTQFQALAAEGHAPVHLPSILIAALACWAPLGALLWLYLA